MDFKPIKIGKYLLLEKLAVGGMAEVYRAKASGAGGFEKQLAIKQILPSYSNNDEFQRMFEYEARLSSMLTHANIVQIYDFVKSGDTYLLSMEYVDGKNLRQFVNKVKKMNITVPIEFGLYIINEVSKGLEYAHKKKDDLSGTPLNIIHRDMSPQNIMLSYEGAVKIVDFGIAKAKDRVDETRSGVIKGKFGYMSPEQANGEDVDLRTDIFSTTIILYELLVNKRLFAAENEMATLKRIQECIVPPPAQVNPKISAELEKIVLKGLSKDLSLRYENSGVFHRALQEHLNKFAPTYSQRNAADLIQRVFSEEILIEKKRFEEAHRQTIPFSQGTSVEPSNPDDEIAVLEGDATKSDSVENTEVTQSEANPALSEMEQVRSGSGSIELEERDPHTLIENILSSDKSVSTLNEEQDYEKKSFDRSNTEPREPSFKLSSLIEEQKSVSTVSRDRTDESNKAKKVAKVISTPVTITPSENIVLNARQVKSQIDPAPESIEPVSKPQRSSVSFSLEDRGLRNRPFRLDEKPSKNFTSHVKTFFTIVILFALAGGTGYLYKIYLEGQFPSFLVMLMKREVSQEGQKNVPSLTDAVRTVGDCALDVSTEPNGAKVFIDGKEVGTSPTILTVNCNRALDMKFQISGFQTYEQNIVPQKDTKIYRQLTKIPLGTLELMVSHNATVKVDNSFFKEVKANEVFMVPLRANRSHVITFENKLFGLKLEREFTVQADTVSRARISLDGSTSKK